MLVCPFCKNENLTYSENEISCGVCSKKFPIDSGIPCFNTDYMYNSESFDSNLFSTLEGASDKHFWYLGRRLVIYNMIKSFYNKDMKMLEMGCGVGGVAKYLYHKEIDIEASDIYLNVLKMLKEKLDIKCYQLDATNIPFEEQYDIIGIFDVLEHIDNDDNVLENINYALKKNGRIVITVPALKFLWSYCDNVAKHKRRYMKKMLKEKLEEVGFHVEKISYMFCFLSPIFILGRLAGNFFTKYSKQKVSLVENELKIIPVLNTIFNYVMKIESYIIKHVNLPFGTSLIVVARKD